MPTCHPREATRTSSNGRVTRPWELGPQSRLFSMPISTARACAWSTQAGLSDPNRLQRFGETCPPRNDSHTFKKREKTGRPVAFRSHRTPVRLRASRSRHGNWSRSDSGSSFSMFDSNSSSNNSSSLSSNSLLHHHSNSSTNSSSRDSNNSFLRSCRCNTSRNNTSWLTNRELPWGRATS